MFKFDDEEEKEEGGNEGDA
jgi:hypothetical protein